MKIAANLDVGYSTVVQKQFGGLGASSLTFDEQTCYYCGNPRQFISMCREKQEDERSGRVCKPHNVRNKIHGRSQYCNMQLLDSRDNVQNGWKPRTEDEFRPNASNQSKNVQSRPSSRFYWATRSKNYHCRSNMARKKFRTTLAQIAEPKASETLIDSGATLNFFFDKIFFQKYD